MRRELFVTHERLLSPVIVDETDSVQLCVFVPLLLGARWNNSQDAVNN